MIADGTRVRVRDAWPERDGPCHIRTPHYVRGRVGHVVRALGTFPNPEDLAFRRPPAPIRRNSSNARRIPAPAPGTDA